MSEDKLESFEYFVLRPNITGGTAIVLSPAPQVIASFTIDPDSDDVVNLYGNVGWQAINNEELSVEKVDVIFEIWRGPVTTGQLIFRGFDSAQADQRQEFVADNFRVSTVKHVDKDFSSSQNVTYNLTARLGTGGSSAATVIGPITFWGEEIKD